MTPQQTKKLTLDEFWDIKHQIDTEVDRLGWSKDYCKLYIKTHYGRLSRLSMSDEQLLDLLETLCNLGSAKIIQPLSSPKNKKRKKRRRS